MNNPPLILPLCSNMFVVTIIAGGYKYKVLQVIFDSEAAFHINLPYCGFTNPGVYNMVCPGNGKRILNIEGKLLKYIDLGDPFSKFTYHQSGEVHFKTKEGKEYIGVKQVTPLNRLEGHVFTTLFSNLQLFKELNLNKDLKYSSRERQNIEFLFEGQIPKYIKIVGRWHSKEWVIKNIVHLENNMILPRVAFVNKETRKEEISYILAKNHDESHLLILSCKSPHLTKTHGKPFLSQFGGLDNLEVINNFNKRTDFRMFSSVISKK